jgi:hypothetical protein
MIDTKSHSATVFSAGFITGALGVLVIGAALLYMLNTTESSITSAPGIPGMQKVLIWVYANLKLSIIPFSFTLLMYGVALIRLMHHLKDEHTPVEKIAQGEQQVDIWINLFFGIGVIWTAVGMRGALLEGIGDLNAQSAAQLGAFSILQRLVDGGILLALSTTIFGAVGGYLLRLVKSLTVGIRLKAYYNQLTQQQTEALHNVLQSIEIQVGRLVTFTEKTLRNEQ